MESQVLDEMGHAPLSEPFVNEPDSKDERNGWQCRRDVRPVDRDAIDERSMRREGNEVLATHRRSARPARILLEGSVARKRSLA
jgi:hypothetical protein